MIRTILLVALSAAAYSQTRLESLTVEGSALPQKTVLDLAGFHIGANIDQAIIEEGCKRLEETGLFSSINFRYTPTPKNGFALTLTLRDQGSLSAASIDIPGVDENEVWQRLQVIFPPFDHKVPGSDAAQQVVAHQIEAQLGPKLQGQKIVTKIETDFARRKSIVSFQPEHLPRIDSMIFTGNIEMTADQAMAAMLKVTTDRGYTDRQFRGLLENNLRPAFEERGLYRVQFPEVKVQFIDPGAVAVTTKVEEGAKYSLGDVTLAGEDLPADRMLAAAKFRKGEVANWTEIQKSIWEMERPLKRIGYFEAAAKPERIFHDDIHVLDLKISFAKGPLYHFGQLRITGLSPELDAKARKLWEKNPGEPYDFAYPNDFLRTFSKSIDLRQFKRYNVRAEKGPGDHTMDITLVFEPR
jgi:outer membrane protein assembly factor BamA